MEYVFGTIQREQNDYEIVRTKASEDLSFDLEGMQTVERKYDDNYITDTFFVKEKYQTATDSEGNIYNWYIIADHNRYIDKFTPSIKKTEREITDLEISMLEMQMVIDEMRESMGLEPYFVSEEEDEDEEAVIEEE